MARLGYLQLNRRCNQACRFCSNPDNGRELSFEQALRAVRHFHELGLHGVILTGGEPTLWPELPRLLQWLQSRGIHARIITNGQKTAERSFLVSLVKAGATHFHVSLYSHKPKTQAWLSNNPQSLANVAKTLHHLKALPADVDCNITVCRQNERTLDDTVRWVIERFDHIRHFSFNYLDPLEARVKANPEVIPSMPESEPAVRRSFKLLSESGRSFRIHKLPPCFLGEFAHCQTEMRMLVKKEESPILFLDERAFTQAPLAFYAMGLQCARCSLKTICAGLFDSEGAYRPQWLRPQSKNAEALRKKIMGE